jgi:hypothetical protein
MTINDRIVKYTWTGDDYINGKFTTQNNGNIHDKTSKDIHPGEWVECDGVIKINGNILEIECSPKTIIDGRYILVDKFKYER